MAAYFIAQVSIQDREAYQAYEQGFMAILDEHGGQLVSVDEQPLVLEGIGPAPERSFYDLKPLRRERPGTTVMPIRRWRKFAFRAPRRTSLWFKGSSSSLMLSVVALSIGCCAVCHAGMVESVNRDTMRAP